MCKRLRTYIADSEILCNECHKLVNPLVTITIEEINRGHGDMTQEEQEFSCSECGSDDISTNYKECDLCESYFDAEMQSGDVCHECLLKQMDASIETINQLTKQIGR